MMAAEAGGVGSDNGGFDEEVSALRRVVIMLMIRTVLVLGRRTHVPIGLTCYVAASAALLSRDVRAAFSRAHLLEDVGQAEERVLPRFCVRPSCLLCLHDPWRQPSPPVPKSPLNRDTRC